MCNTQIARGFVLGAIFEQVETLERLRSPRMKQYEVLRNILDFFDESMFKHNILASKYDLSHFSKCALFFLKHYTKFQKRSKLLYQRSFVQNRKYNLTVPLLICLPPPGFGDACTWPRGASQIIKKHRINHHATNVLSASSVDSLMMRIAESASIGPVPCPRSLFALR